QIAAAEARCLAREEKGIDPEVDIVALNSEMTVLKLGGNDKLTVLSYETDDSGKVIGTRLYDEEGDPCGIEYGKPVDYETDYWGTFVPTDYEVMGAYYLVDKDCTEFIDTMKFHGVEIVQLEKDLTLPAGAYQWYDLSSYSSGGSVVDGRQRTSYEGHYQTLVDGEWVKGAKSIVIPAGTYVLPTCQVMGSFAALMCEPAAVDGGVAWNFFDDYFDQAEGTFRANYSSTVKVVITKEGSDETEETEKTVSIPILKVADFKTIDLDHTGQFKDVAKSDWFYDDVQFVFDNGLMKGTGSDTFSPQMTTTRGMIVTILHRMEGEPAPGGECPFDDVKANSYYEKAIAWAAENKIVTGYSDTKFGPDDNITREQMAAILYRYAQTKGSSIDEGWSFPSEFTDVASISDYAVDAMKWCVKNEIIGGVGGGKLSPNTSATRAQVAAILHRYCEKI
ncbi:MAG: S-layer homology domain-containing protein, partial [Firmicutes bacterium]|nr:S-layer homology domain-containing protein [Bacillota bacterium]